MKNPIMEIMRINKRGTMKKNLLITLGITLVLFIYGYLASIAGHDHSSHSQGNAQVEEVHSHSDHSH